MYSFISKKPSTSLEDVPNMPRAFYELVQSGQLIKFMNKVVRTQRSEDGTVKSLLELHVSDAALCVIRRFLKTRLS